MSTELVIHSRGAVTAVGLDGPQSCAAIRAGISAFQQRVADKPTGEPQLVAAVPVKWQLRVRETQWLINLAGRAIGECLRSQGLEPTQTPLLLVVPDSFRGHPGMEDLTDRQLIEGLQQRLRLQFHPRTAVFHEGAASVMSALRQARTYFQEAAISGCIVCGVDSFLNEIDLGRLRAQGRLQGPDNAQGLVPGEGAAAILVRPALPDRSDAKLPRIIGIGTGRESQTVLGPKYPCGDGIQSALEAAAAESGAGEPAVAFVASTFNGERYGAWENMLAHPRFYRTRRPILQTVFPAMSVGEIGAASAVLSIIVGTTGMARGYLPGQTAMCEAYSDEGLRGACVISVARSEETPQLFQSQRASKTSFGARTS